MRAIETEKVPMMQPSSPTAMSDRAEEVERALTTIAGKRKTVDLSVLTNLGLAASPVDRDTGFGRPCRSFSATGKRFLLPRDVPVWSFQSAVRVDVVRVKMRELLRGVVLPDALVTDRPASRGFSANGSWWLLDGHHTLVAARMVGVDVYGSVWR